MPVSFIRPKFLTRIFTLILWDQWQLGTIPDIQGHRVQHSPALHVLSVSQVVKTPTWKSFRSFFSVCDISLTMHVTVVPYLGSLLEFRYSVVFLASHWPDSTTMMRNKCQLWIQEYCGTEIVKFSHPKHILLILANIWTYFNFIIFLPENKLNGDLENIRPKRWGKKKQKIEWVSFYYKIWADWPYN